MIWMFAHPTYFAAKIYLKVNFQIAFTIKLRTWRVQIIQRKKQKKYCRIKTKSEKIASCARDKKSEQRRVRKTHFYQERFA